MKYIPPSQNPPDSINSPDASEPTSILLVFKKVIFFLILPYALIFSLFQIFPVNLLPASLETRMGRWMAPAVKSPSEDSQKMMKILKKIAPPHPRVPLSVAVTPASGFNAATYPGGIIRFHRGAFQALKSEEEKAMILAHEIGHSELGHIGKRLSKSLLMLIPEMILRSLGIDMLDISHDLVRKVFSRKDEQDADDYAAQLLITHYGSLDGGVKAFEAMERAVGTNEVAGQVGSYFSTHPLTQQRIERLKKMRGTLSEQSADSQEEPAGSGE